MKLAAVIPAYNEEHTIGAVLKTICASKIFSDVIVVDDGSTDKTAESARLSCARVIRQGNQGKGAAMRAGVQATNADIIFFADADLLNFREEHIKILIQPIIDQSVQMTVGLRERGRFITWFLPKIAPVLGGERALSRKLFLKLSGEATKDFGIETVMNEYCRKNNLPVRYIYLKGVKQVIKERKYGFWKGFSARMKMVGQIIKAEIEMMKRK